MSLLKKFPTSSLILGFLVVTICTILRGESSSMPDPPPISPYVSPAVQKPNGGSGNGGPSDGKGSKPSAAKAPPITESKPAEAAPAAAAKTSTAIDAANQQSLDPNAINNLNAASANAALVDAALINEAKSGKWDNSKLPALLQALGAAVTKPNSGGQNSNSNGDSGTDAGNLTTESGNTNSNSSVPAPINPNQASAELLGLLTEGLTNLFADKQNGNLSHELVTLSLAQPGSTRDLASGDAQSTNADGQTQGLAFNDASGTLNPNGGKRTNKSLLDGSNLNSDATGVAGGPVNLGDLTKEAIKEKIKEFLDKKIAETPKDAKQKSVNDLLAAVKSDPQAYDRFIDTMADKLAEGFQPTQLAYAQGREGFQGANAELGNPAAIAAQLESKKLAENLAGAKEGSTGTAVSSGGKGFAAKAMVILSIVFTGLVLVAGDRKRPKLKGSRTKVRTTAAAPSKNRRKRA